jgi:hypothetical protein
MLIYFIQSKPFQNKILPQIFSTDTWFHFHEVPHFAQLGEHSNWGWNGGLEGQTMAQRQSDFVYNFIIIYMFLLLVC